MKKLLGTPFGLALVALLVLAGWASWTAGIFDGPIAKEVRSSSVYVAPGLDIDTAAAEKIIGNRRLVVVFLERGADLSEGCDDTSGAADGTLVLLISRETGSSSTTGARTSQVTTTRTSARRSSRRPASPRERTSSPTGPSRR